MCRDEDWQENDGALNTISMTRPLLPVEHPSRFVKDDSECHPLQPGIWLVFMHHYLSFLRHESETINVVENIKHDEFAKCRYYKIVEADHIFFIVNRERAGVQFDLIYDSIFERCRKHVFRKTPPTLPNQTHH